MRLYTISTNFTRPANTLSYSFGDLIANSTTAGSVVPMVFNVPCNGFLLTQVNISTTNTNNTQAIFNLNLYQFSPTVTNGDNGAFLSSQSGYLGTVLVDCTQLAFNNAVSGWGFNDPNSLSILIDSTLPDVKQVYGLLSLFSPGYAPISGEIFTVTLLGTD